MIRGVLFDMDGVLVDSEAFICRAAIMMFGYLGVKVEENDFLPFVGMGENRYIGGVAEKYGVQLDIEQAKARTYAVYETIARNKLKALPGVHEFVNRCRERGLKLALATSADRVKMEVNLKEIGLPEKTFQAIVQGLDVQRKKPFPDIYRKAAEKLDLPPSQCLVVEDAVSGVKAALSAGCRCLALTTSFTAGDLSEADWVCSTLLNVPDEALNW